jgi:pyruvate formate-lyase/glycerol dehydratase family glycyl radical enzyme
LEGIVDTRIAALKDIVTHTAPEICDDRLRSITASYRETEGLPVVLRRAYAFDRILAEMQIYILDGELIVGNQAFQPKAAPWFPEFDVQWIEQEIDSLETRRLDPFRIAADKREETRDLIQYWKGKTHRDLCLQKLDALLPAEMKQLYDIQRCNINQTLGNLYHTITGDGHIIADYDRVLRQGLGLLKEQARQRLEGETDGHKADFLKAVVISIDAVVKFAHRLADLAEDKAGSEPDAARRQELLTIARNCRNVPEKPAASFHEALQSLWLVHLVIQLESNGQSISFGRFDQYMNPYYLRDRDKGLLDREKAIELIQCLFLKAMEVNKIRDWGSTEFNTGYAMYQTLTVGGQTRDGRDAANEMTYMVLEATADLKVQEPTTVMRLHRGTPDELLAAAVNTLVEHRGGLPSFFNDEVAIPMLQSLPRNQIPLEDARDWAVMGCVEPTVPGKYIPSTGGTCVINLAKAFELAFNDGVNPETGMRVFRPQQETIESYDDMWHAYQEQLEYYMNLVPTLMQATCGAYRELTPTPFLSALISDRLDRASDLFEGKGPNDYDVELMEIHGLGTATDALAAVKIAVFDEQRFTLDELRTMIRRDFEGYERERLYLKNKVGKYGNDVAEVDAIAATIVATVCDHMARFVTPRNGCFGLSTQTTTCNVPDGKVVGATPDGRLAHAPLSDNHSPSPAADRKGPTAAMKSVASTGHDKVGMGTLYNMKFTPMQFSTEEGRKKFAELIKGYFAQGGFHVQFNVVSNETLRAAQKDPAAYRDLIVKVAGYSARFTDLDRQLQDQLIARTMFGE